MLRSYKSNSKNIILDRRFVESFSESGKEKDKEMAKGSRERIRKL